MPATQKPWTPVARSEFPWEQEALDVVHEHAPARDSPGLEHKVPIELEEQVDVKTRDLDSLMHSRRREAANTARANWTVVLRAAAAPADAGDWKPLAVFVERCLSAVTGSLRSPERTVLATHPGLLARYDRINAHGDLTAAVGRTDDFHGRGVLVPANDQGNRPTLNHKALPLPRLPHPGLNPRTSRELASTGRYSPA